MQTELTIVIPASHADAPLSRLLNSLCRQEYPGIRDTPVLLIVDGAFAGSAAAGKMADPQELVQRFSDRLTVQVVRAGSAIRSGSPAAARNAGALFATTPYVLFLDPDVELADRPGLDRELDRSLLRRAMDAMKQRSLHLATTSVACPHGGFFDDLLFLANNVIQRAGSVLHPFATGMFMLFDRAEFLRLGGFNEKLLFGEDYLLSKAVTREHFQVVRGRVLTTNRHWRRVGPGRMAWLLAQAMLHTWDECYFLREGIRLGRRRAEAVSRESYLRDGLLQDGLLSDDGL